MLVIVTIIVAAVIKIINIKKEKEIQVLSGRR